VYVQVVTYSLEGITEGEYLDTASRLAPRFANLPGLLAKIWLENPGGNRYGAVYFWDDLESMERFDNSDLFEDGTPELTDLVAEEFGVLENLTAMTQPVLEILEPRLAPAPPPAKRAAVKHTGVKAGQPAAKRTPPPRRASTATPPTKKAPAKKAPAKKAPAKAAKKAAKAPAKKAAKRVRR
jgi:heme-degrading monooxygenase HmoA